MLFESRFSRLRFYPQCMISVGRKLCLNILHNQASTLSRTFIKWTECGTCIEIDVVGFNKFLEDNSRLPFECSDVGDIVECLRNWGFIVTELTQTCIKARHEHFKLNCPYLLDLFPNFVGQTPGSPASKLLRPTHVSMYDHVVIAAAVCAAKHSNETLAAACCRLQISLSAVRPHSVGVKMQLMH